MTRRSASATAGLLADLAALGPYFAVDVHRPGSPPRPPWQPLDALIGSPDALAGRIGEVRERLAAAAGLPATAVEFRVAASIAQLGLCARLLSPALGAAAAGRALPVDVGQARWIPALGGPFRLSLPDTVLEAGAVRSSAAAGSAATAGLLAGPITQIVRAVAGDVGLPARAVGQRRLGRQRRRHHDRGGQVRPGHPGGRNRDGDARGTRP